MYVHYFGASLISTFLIKQRNNGNWMPIISPLSIIDDLVSFAGSGSVQGEWLAVPFDKLPLHQDQQPLTLTVFYWKQDYRVP